MDTAIEFHEDRAAYALLRCNAWDSVIDLEEVNFSLASVARLFLKFLSQVCGAYTQE